MDTKTTFTFSFKVGDRTYSFNEVAKNEEKGLRQLYDDMGKMQAEIKKLLGI